MSNIPYNFTPIPNYFRINGWFNDHDCLVYVSWAFSRCSATSKKTFFSHKEIQLDPFEYISGREACSKETGLTPQQVRTQQKRLLDSGILEKSTSKSTNRFSVYKWVTSRFSENVNQQNNQQSTSSQPAVNHKQEAKKKEERRKEAIAVSSPLLYAESDFAFLVKAVEDHGVVIFPKTIRSWLKKYPLQYVAENLNVLFSKKKKPANDEAWMETALKENYAKEKSNMELNRQFIIDFISEHKWTDMKVSQQYCTHKPSSNDYMFTLPHNTFKNNILHCYNKQAGVL